MYRTLMSTMLASAAFLATLPSDAHATHGGLDHRFRHASISWAPVGGNDPIVIRVENDGEQYTHVSGQVSTRFRLRARVKAGRRLHGFMVTTYDPDVQRNLPMPQASRVAVNEGLYQRAIDRHRTVNLSAADFVRVLDHGSPLFTMDGEQKLINQCNALYADSKPENDAAGIVMHAHIHAGFSAGSYAGMKMVSWNHWFPSGASGGPSIASTTVPIQVMCGKFEKPQSILDAQLHAVPSGGTCPQQIKMTVGLATAEPRQVDVRYRVNQGPWSPWNKVRTHASGGGAMGLFEQNLAGFQEGTHVFEAQVEEVDGTLKTEAPVGCALQVTKADLVAFQHGVSNPNSGAAMVLPVPLETKCPVEIGLKPNFTHTGSGNLQYRFRFLPQDVTTTAFSAKFEHGKSAPEPYHVFPLPLPQSGGGGSQGIGGFQAQPNAQPDFGLKLDDGGAGPNEHKGSVRLEAETAFGLVASNWVPYHIICEPKSVFEPVGGITLPQPDPEPKAPTGLVVTPKPPVPVIVTPAPDPDPPATMPSRLVQEPQRILQGLRERSGANPRPQPPATLRVLPGRSAN